MKSSPQDVKQMGLDCEWVQKTMLVTIIGSNNSVAFPPMQLPENRSSGGGSCISSEVLE